MPTIGGKTILSEAAWRIVMIQPGSGKTLANERRYPNIVELAVPADGLEIELSRRIMEFHKSRHNSAATWALDYQGQPNLWSLVLCRFGYSLRLH